MYYLLWPLSFFSDSYSDMSQYLPYEKYVRYERNFLPATIYVKKKKKIPVIYCAIEIWVIWTVR